MRFVYFSFFLIFFLVSCTSIDEENNDDEEAFVTAFSNSLYHITFEELEKVRNGWYFHFSIESTDESRNISPETMYIDFPEEITFKNVSLEKQNETQIEKNENEPHILYVKQLYTGSIGENVTSISVPAIVHIEQPARIVYFYNIDEDSLPVVREELLLESIVMNDGEITIQATDIFDIRRTSWSLIVNDERIYPVTSYTTHQSRHHYQGRMEFAVFPEPPLTLVAERLQSHDVEWELDFLLPIKE